MLEITFPSMNPCTLAEAGTAASRCPRIMTSGRLFLPLDAGRGAPRPAVVVLEGLGGIIPERELRYAAMLAHDGYVTLAVDTFGPRGAVSISHPMRALRVTEASMLADAYGALRYLAGLPIVDRDRIAVMGFSYGAMVSVFAAYRQVQEIYAPDGLRFAAHAAYYGCTVARFTDPVTTGAPVRLFVGGLDQNVCVERTHTIAGDLRRGGSDVHVHLYPDAYHQWDARDLTPRFTHWSLRRYAFVVEPDNRVWDTRTRLTMRGPMSRAAMLLANMDPSGYHMLRDERVLVRSDAALLDFLSDAIGRSAARVAHPIPSVQPAGGDAGAGSGILQTAASWK